MRSHTNHPRRSTQVRPFSWQACRRRRRQLGELRRGAAAVLGLVLTISLVTLMAFTIDFGYINVAETQMRRSVDAAAMAACWEMFDQQVGTNSTYISESSVLAAANASATLNPVGNHAMQVASSDLVLGTYGADQSWDTSDPSSYNAVRVTLRRNTDSNGEVPLFFGQLTGRNSQALQITATAAMYSSIAGFHEPDDSTETLDLFPFTIKLDTWEDVCAGTTEDDYTCANGVVSNGSDGVHEAVLFPVNGGSPGNYGTVDIGGSNNSTSDLARQILHGISKQDLIDLGHPLEFDSNGELELNGDTGISAGIKDELAAIIGQTRIIPIYTQLTGNGNNAMYTIVRWEAITILYVKLTGKKSDKRIVVQPAKAVARYAKVDYTGNSTSNFVVTPVMLVE